jgi:hypothetical protein
MTNTTSSSRRLKYILLMIVVIAIAVALGRAGFPGTHTGMWDGPI